MPIPYSDWRCPAFVDHQHHAAVQQAKQETFPFIGEREQGSEANTCIPLSTFWRRGTEVSKRPSRLSLYSDTERPRRRRRRKRADEEEAARGRMRRRMRRRRRRTWKDMYMEYVLFIDSPCIC